jgi:hypothetical protein
MAYTNSHKLQLIRKVCDLYKANQGKENTVKDVFYKHIYPVYPIAYSTFYSYLSTPIAAKEREMEKTGHAQLSLF